jgi:hypothetical protein
MPIAAVSAAEAGSMRSDTHGRPHTPYEAKVPDAPKPVTPANAAVHIMQVPSSRVVEAFISLQRAMGQQQQREHKAPLPTAPAPLTELPTGDAPKPRRRIDLEA